MTRLDELASELAAAGVRGRWARRALDEARDHLAELGPERASEFGDPRTVAGEIAAIVATAHTRRAASVAFAALAATGGAYLTAGILVARAGWPDIASGHAVVLGVVAALAIAFAPQVTFVAGMLMAWRVVRLRLPAPAAELGVVRRRAAVALAGAAVTSGAWILYAAQFSSSIRDGWVAPAVIASSAAALAGLTVSASLLAATAKTRALPGGTAGDVFDDLRPLLARTPLARADLGAHPWRFALAVAGAVGAVTVAWGWNAEGTLAEGLVRGVPEALAVIASYAALGRVLALRR